MNGGEHNPGTIDLRRVAAATAVVVGTVAMAGIAYLLLDILLLLFLGIVVAAALQPWHVMLRRWGVPKGLAVLVIYLLLLSGLVLIALVVGPMLIEQFSAFAAEAPATYASVRSQLQASATAPFHLIGQRLPPFEHLAETFTGVAPQLYQGAVGVTTGVLKLFAYFVTVLVVGFYWTMEVPRLERLLLSLLAVERRSRALNIWHEVESKLGGFMRGKGLAMLAIGVASAIGYALIGLPNILALAVLAGLLEAVPLIGPVLAVVPALLVAVPLGLNTVLLVVGFTILLQLIENNVLVPRIMHRAVGVSALVGILAVLVFGTLYGFLGVLVAIPMTAVIQVLLDSTLINAEPAEESQGLVDSPWADLRTRVRALRQQARVRLRARTSRMGIDPATTDHVVDAVDQQIEVAVARVEKIIAAAEETSEPMAANERAAIVDELRDATEEIEQTVERVDTIVAAAEESFVTGGPTRELALAERDLNGAGGRLGPAIQPVEALTEAPASSASVPVRERDAIVDTLDRATQRIKDVVQDVETRVVAAQEESIESHVADNAHHIEQESPRPTGR